MNEAVKRAGDFWSARTIKQPRIVSSAWQTSPRLVKYVNGKLGAPESDKYGGGFRRNLERRLKKRDGASRAVSVGGGNGSKEMHYVRHGLIQHLDLFEASEIRIEQGREVAQKLGVSDKVDFHLVTDEGYPDAGNYDLVYWDSALHHMPDVYEAMYWTKNALNKGGLMAMYEYVGPDRFQWTEESLAACDAFRNALPPRFFVSQNDEIIPRKAQRVNRENLIKRDPSEAIDSSRILDAVRLVFPDSEIIPLGGAIYHVALRQILPNFTTEEDQHYIDMALVLDKVFEDKGDMHFAVAFAEKA